jgi:pSer/pThr/pTyr-binding forkhead associated (FHA) protein
VKLMLEMVTPEKWKGTHIPVAHLPFFIGREPGCHLRSGSSTLAPRHGALISRNNRIIARNLAADNGMVVNDLPVQQERELHDGDCVKLGCLTFSVVLQSDAPHPRTDRAPASKEDEIGNLLLEMDKEEGREHGDPAAAGGEGSRFSCHSSALPANNSSSVRTDSAQQELPDPATAAARLLSKFERPFGLPVGKRK